MEDNFLKINSFGLKDKWIFIDSLDFLIVPLLQKYNVRLFPTKYSFLNDKYPSFQLVLVKARKRDKKILTETIFPKLHNKLMICKGRDYLEVVKMLQKIKNFPETIKD